MGSLWEPNQQNSDLSSGLRSESMLISICGWKCDKLGKEDGEFIFKFIILTRMLINLFQCVQKGDSLVYRIL